MRIDLPVLEDLPDPGGARVLLRADLNVPLRPGAGGTAEVADDFRIRAALPTLTWLVGRGAEVTVCSHLGRPKGRVQPALSMAPVRARLQELVPGVTVMENLRFDPGEESNDPAFVDRLVDGQDLYVDDAFGAAHRAHASVVGPPARLPSAAGRLFEREVEVLGRLVDTPDRPFVAVVGGAKVADKLGVLEVLSEKVDVLLVGGGMCFTFLAALGHEIGASLFDAEHIEACRRLLRPGNRIVLPSDVLALSPDSQMVYAGVPGAPGAASPGPPEAAGAPAGAAAWRVVLSDRVRCFERDLDPGWVGLDIGPETALGFAEEIERAATVLWNGPMGAFEDPRFGAGTRAVARALAACRGLTVAGGGDTTAALQGAGLADRIDHVSTGGGATLELIEKGDLPGIAALRESRGRTATDGSGGHDGNRPGGLHRDGGVVGDRGGDRSPARD